MAISELSADVAEDWTSTGETEQINKYLLLIGARFNLNKICHGINDKTLYE